MNYIDKTLAARLPFLNGKAKRLFIDGQWVEARSGKIFKTG